MNLGKTENVCTVASVFCWKYFTDTCNCTSPQGLEFMNSHLTKKEKKIATPCTRLEGSFYEKKHT